jgi:mono/diheme cytochrome c family protein
VPDLSYRDRAAFEVLRCLNDFSHTASVSPLWRLATVTRFSAGSISPLAAICRPSLRAFSSTALFVQRFRLAHFHAWLASHSHSVPADEKEGTPYYGADATRVVLIGIAVLAFAGSASLKNLNVSQPERDVFSGRVIYSTICIRCHGVDGKGGGQMKFTPPVADLTSPAVQGKLDARLFKSMHDRTPNTAMRAWRESLLDDEIWDALVYVRTLAPEGVGGIGRGLR